MKTIVQLLGMGVLLLGLLPPISGQSFLQGCQDRIRMQDGSKLIGQIRYAEGNDTLIFTTASGMELHIPADQVVRVVQKCGNGRSPVWHTFRQYNFREHGWYHHTRIGTLIGEQYYGWATAGLQLQHSTGWMFSRFLGLGLGSGLEYFTPGADDVTDYPVFGEMRSYLLAKHFSPYITLGGGWAFVNKESRTSKRFEGSPDESWRGGWLAQAEVGYRFGQHFTIHAGIRFQEKRRNWQSTSWWGGNPATGTDRILHKRLSLGLGVLF
ncbi:MAG: hypothetical protein EP344_06240 [Bacteroidetes bacterium]|nr:MAG: hypothetical protein EP344_06240 [Bacteroidota bacterium]